MEETGTYGHFGQAVYDCDEKEWRFAQSADFIDIWCPLGESKRIFQGQSSPGTGVRSKNGKEGPSRRRENQAKALVKVHPELQPASNLLLDLARISEAVDETSTRHDPAIGNLLAFGIITDELAKRQVEVVACPSGPTGSDLRIAEVKAQGHGWGSSRTVYIQVPTIYGEEATWKGPGVTIQSIDFADPIEDGEMFLAVRLVMETLIFRPVLRKRYGSDTSRMDVNLLIRLSIAETGDSPHADVAFNPWYSREFAVLDQHGSWVLWELDSKQTRNGKQLCAHEHDIGRRKTSKSLSDDRWGRLSWVGGPSVIAVCSRRNVRIFNVTESEPVELHKIDVGLAEGPGWVLDMTVVPSRPRYLIILTSTHVILVYVESGQDGDVEVEIVTRVLHFRNPQDISLRLYCFGGEEDTILFIRSDFDPTVLVYQLSLGGRYEIAIADPVELHLITSTTDKSASRISSLHLHTIESKGNLNLGLNNHLSLPSDIQAPRYFQLTTLHKDFSVEQTLYLASRERDTPFQPGAPTWERKLTKSAYKTLDDDFIVEDGDEDEMETFNTEPVSAFIKSFEGNGRFDSNEWTVDHEIAVSRLNDVEVSDVVDLDEVLEDARDILTRRQVDNKMAFRTLRELSDGEFAFQDIEGYPAQLEKLLKPVTQQTSDDYEMDQDDRTTRLMLRAVPLPPVLRLPDLGGSDGLKAAQEAISERWNRSLPTDISDIVRLSKEQLARRVAAEIALASLVLCPQGPQEMEQPIQSQSQSQPQAWELPVRSGAPVSSRTTPSLFFEASSQPQLPLPPTPSTSGPASVRSSSSHQSDFPTEAIKRLSQYTTFTGTTFTPPLSRRLNRVLSHWTPGADPSTYDWLSASRHISRRDEEEAEGEEMTEKERARLQRRAERYVRRQRREAEETQRLQLLSSQIPGLVSGSQPVALSRGSSQQAGPGGKIQSQSQGRSQDQMVASQVLPGRHGGRAPAKKKRKSGF